MKPRSLYSFSFAAVAFLAGCQNPSIKIEEVAQKLGQSWAAQASELNQREARMLSWMEAQEIVRKHNPSIRKATEEQFRAQRSVKQVYKNLLPTVRLHATVSRRLQELDQFSFEDIRWDLNVYSFLSGVLSLGRDVYTAELTYIRSSLLLELTSREKIIELHRLFVLSQQIEVARQRLAENERILRNVPTTGRLVESPRATLQAMRDQLRIAEEKIEADLLSLFGVPAVHYRLVGEGLPSESFINAASLSSDPLNVGVLRRKLFAIEIVGAQARLRGAKLRYWPDISLYLSSGPLWATGSGETVWWTADDLRLFTSAYLPLDINGQIRNRVRDAKIDLQILREEIALRETVLVSELEYKRRALVQIDRELAEAERKRVLLMQLVAIEGADNLGNRLKQWMDVESQRASLLVNRAQLNSFFLFFDERFWATNKSLSIESPVSVESDTSNET